MAYGDSRVVRNAYRGMGYKVVYQEGLIMLVYEDVSDLWPAR
jgi:hypothetical protein